MMETGIKHKIDFLLSSDSDSSSNAGTPPSSPPTSSLHLPPQIIEPSFVPAFSASTFTQNKSVNMVDNATNTAVINTAVKLSSSSNCSMKNKKNHINRSAPYEKHEEHINVWLSALRAQTYCGILSDSTPDENGDHKLKCTFSANCEKRIKGKGNLRRHIEWHLRRIEEETKNSGNNTLPCTVDLYKVEAQKKILQEKLTNKYLRPKTVSIVGSDVIRPNKTTLCA